MNERGWGMIAFGVTLGVVVALRLNAAGMLLVATLLLAALLLCPLLTWRLTAGDMWPEEELTIRVEPMPRDPPAPRRSPPALAAGPSLSARRGPAIFHE